MSKKLIGIFFAFACSVVFVAGINSLDLQTEMSVDATPTQLDVRQGPPPQVVCPAGKKPSSPSCFCSDADCPSNGVCGKQITDPAGRTGKACCVPQ